MITSKYQQFYSRLKEKMPQALQPLGGRLLVEILPEIEMKSAGGLFVGTASSHRSNTKENQFTAALVLDVGTGYVDDDGQTVDISIRPGSVVAINKTAARIYSTHPMLGGQFTSGDLADINEGATSTLIAESLSEYNRLLATIDELKRG